MRVLLVICFLWTSLLFACGNDELGQSASFAKINEDYSVGNFAGYDVYVPEIFKDYYLTSFTVVIKDTLLADLNFTEANSYEGYYKVFFQVNPERLDSFNIVLGYSTTKDKKGIVMCGERIQLNLKELLRANQPEMIIAPPPPLK
ncbi:hypothetical protein H5087_11595 [Pseudoalteromonas sp. SR43-7]|uniref:hypothetical protein n=1 Tax=Pseudoalteromonas sp. SR43-7 TaxID=2760939 RepID=UPI0015F9C580|nr:hypothetical protein [Pseudoalteromonas sp. SR43-7]MBB1329992.1 hypothetical protein [Pseudoalteromonas sp. SR43-7]